MFPNSSIRQNEKEKEKEKENGEENVKLREAT